MSTINRTTIVFSILHREDEPVESLEEALERADQGHGVGDILAQVTVPLKDEEVAEALKAMGNDGEFFDLDLEEDDDV